MISKIVLLLLAVIVHDVVCKQEYEFVGCYKDKEARDLTLGAKWHESKQMTLKKCANLCKGAAYIGLQHADECHCGKSFGKYGKNKTGCKMACTGNKNEICGDFWHNSVYKKVEKINGKLEPEYVGCYIDEKNERDLNGKTYLNSPEMTIKKCARHCKGFKYMGVQYSTECYCDNRIGKYGRDKEGKKCNMKCKGANRQICGGQLRNSVYRLEKQTPPQLDPTFVGCYVDKESRDLNGKKYLDSSEMTVRKCARHCKGFKYMGVQYGKECYCDNYIGKYGKDRSGKTCNMKCTGANRQICGGHWRNSVYKL